MTRIYFVRHAQPKRRWEDERLRERDKGAGGNTHDLFEKRWKDLDYHERHGESIHMVQKRNIEALMELLSQYEGKTIVIGTHGTALSAIFHYFDSNFGSSDFLRIIDWMSYIAAFDFEGEKLVSKEECCNIEKEF